jgi:UDP-N-acetylglucosamine acyltransferase
MGVHPTAVVDPEAEIGEDVHIGPGCVIGPGVRIGAGCSLLAHVVVDGDTWIGEGCELFPFSTLGTRPQDKKLSPDSPLGRLRIGRNNKLRENVTIHGGTKPSSQTTIGDDNMFLCGSHVGHDGTVGNGVVFTNGAMAAGHCEIQDRAILGAMVGVHQFTRVGRFAMIGAGAMLSQDAPPFSLVQGDRARLIAINVVGLQRGGFTPDQTALLKRLYRIVFWRDGVLAERLAAGRAFAQGDPLALEVLSFVASSKRGVCMPRGRAAPGEEHTLSEL